RSVIDDRALLRGDLLADAAGECGGSLAIEIAFQTVTDRLVQQDAGPARSEHDRHRSRRRGARIQIHDCAAHGLGDELLPAIVLEEFREAVASAAPAIALLAPA